MSLPTLHDIQARLGGKVCGTQWRGPTFGHPADDRGMTVALRADGCGFVVNVFQPNEDWREQRDQLQAMFGLTADQIRQPTPAERRKLRAEMAKAQAERVGRQLARCVARADEGVRPEPGSPVRSGYLVGARGLPASTVAMAVSAGSLLEHRDERGRVSMLALAHNRNGVLRGVQLTKLRPDGSDKRGTECDRLTFGPYKGSACRLFKPTGDTLAVAEGVETALAFYTLRKVPTWATFGAANLAAFEPPAGVRRLVIAADGDAPGMEAAQALFDRLRRRVRCIIAPAPEGLDWLDVLNRGGGSCR
jgi:putative DNA primase/helicase